MTRALLIEERRFGGREAVFGGMEELGTDVRFARAVDDIIASWRQLSFTRGVQSNSSPVMRDCGSTAQSLRDMCRVAEYGLISARCLSCAA